MIKNYIVTKKRYIVGLLFSIIFLIIIIVRLNFRDFLNNIVYFQYKYILLFIPLYLINQILKGLRLKFIINKPVLKYNDSFFESSFGNFLNICLPCRFGDLWKISSLSQIIKMPKTEMLGSIILERYLDILSLIPFLFFITFYTCAKNNLILSLIQYTLLLSIIIILSIVITKKLNKKIKNKYIEYLITGITSYKTHNNLINCYLLSIFLRLNEALLVMVLIKGINLKISYISAFFVIVFNALSGAIPSISGYIGAYQYSYILALSIFNVPESVAFAIVTIYEFTTLVLLGIIAIFCIKRKVK